jgi:serine/threonine protein kinase
VVDFGLSAKYKIKDNRAFNLHCGTLIYMAPEVALKQDYTKSVDIWSIGIIMYYVLTGGRHPLYISNADNVETYKKKL